MRKFLSFSRVGVFRASEDGAVSAEAVLWMPLYAFLLALIADTALMFGGQAQIMRAIQDVNRAYSVGAFGVAGETGTNTAAQDALFSMIGGLTPSAEIKTQLMNGSFVVTTVHVPTKDILATGMLSIFSGRTMTLTAGHRTES